MAITTETITTANCDLCGKPIATSVETYVDAMAYGASFHVNCISSGQYQILKILGLDDIQLVDVDGERKKFIYALH